MKAEGQHVKELGGLHIVGTERHEARRIDLQLRGRCGRQGDPGSSRFYLSLEDDLMRIFAGEWVKNVLTRLGMQEGEAIESKMVSRRIEGAQKKVEERNFEVRKNLLEYDEVMDEQRKRVYSLSPEDSRRRQLPRPDHRDDRPAGRGKRSAVSRPDLRQRVVRRGRGQFAPRAARRPKTIAALMFTDAERIADDEASRMAESQVFDAIEENLPDDEDQSEWNWDALATLGEYALGPQPARSRSQERSAARICRNF